MKRKYWAVLLFIGINCFTMSTFSSESAEETYASVINETDSLPAADQDIVMDMGPPLKITTFRLIPAVMKSAYKEKITTKGGSESFTYTATELPSGISISEAGIIFGTPEGPPGESQVTITATDLKFPEKKETRNFVFTVFAPLEVVTTTIPDALIENRYKTKLEPTGGSGRYEFTTDGLPANLSISKKGKLTGRVIEKSGHHSFKVKLTDRKTLVSIEKNIQLNIVDFFPDDYESLNDNGFETANTMKPGDKYQKHNFNLNGDVDFIKLDLSHVNASDVIKINTNGVTGSGKTMIKLFDSDRHQVEFKSNTGSVSHSQVIYECPSPGIYFFSVEDVEKQTGEYNVVVSNTGPKLRITTKNIPDALKSHHYSLKIESIDGSGNYQFSAIRLPADLIIDKKGVISGTMMIPSGNYPLTIRVDDTSYPGIFTEKELIINVVDFFPDEYETKNDNNFQTTNRIKPGDSVQNHTFNFTGDEDYILLDLTGVAPGDVLDIKTFSLTQTTTIHMSLYNSQKNMITSADISEGEPLSRRIYECTTPDIFFVKIEETNQKTGDYGFSLINTGPKVRISTTTIPDALKSSTYQLPIKVKEGSGYYLFSTIGLPDGLVIDQKGLIIGTIMVPSGNYPFTIQAYDSSYPGIFAEKSFILNVVDFFPDDYETNNDNGFETTNIMPPDGDVQQHTFHTAGDSDYLKLDLTDINPGDVIKIESNRFTVPTNTKLTLYNSDHHVVASDSNGGNENYSKIVFHCKKPGIYYLKSEETKNALGDYTLSMINTGSKLQIITSKIQDILKATPYKFRIPSTGGTGGHIFTMVTNLPEGLKLNENGMISGNVAIESKPYLFAVKAFDALHPENNTQQEIAMTVVDYYPDSYEINGDNDFQTTNTMIPGTTQEHNFNSKNDEDVIRLDLRDVPSGDVFIFETAKLTTLTYTTMSLYNSSHEFLRTHEKSVSGNYSKIVFNCKTPGIYYLKIKNRQKKTGDYRLLVNNSGQKLKIATKSIPIAESVEKYNTTIDTTGGSGEYVYSISKGALPHGLSIGPNTGNITGNNINWGTYTFTIHVKDQLYPENNNSQKFKIEAYMGKKITGAKEAVYPHYLSGTFSTDIEFEHTTASPGRLNGGTPNNLRYEILSHNIPTPRFNIMFNNKSGVLKLKEVSPLACKQYNDIDMEIEVEVKDRVCTNNTFIFRYHVPVKCLTY